MKVTHILHQFPVPGETFIWLPLNRLREESDYPVSLISLGRQRSLRQSIPAGLRSLSQHARLLRLKKLETGHRILRLAVTGCKRLGTPLVGGTLKDFVKDGLLLSKIYQWEEGSPSHTLHCHFGTSGLQIARATETLSVKPRILTSFYGFDASRIPHHWGENVYESLFRVGNHFTAPSKQMANHLIHLGCPARKLQVVPLSVAESFFTKPRGANPFGKRRLNLVSVGRLVEKKGIQHVFPALPNIRRKIGMEVRYHILGDGPLKGKLEKAAKELGVQSWVRFHGWSSPSLIREILQTADLFLLPCSQGTNGDAEGTPTAILEALASHCPVVSTRHGGIPEILGEGRYGLLMEDNHPQTIADTVIHCLTTASTKNRTTEGANYVWCNHREEVVLHHWTELYRSP